MHAKALDFAADMTNQFNLDSLHLANKRRLSKRQMAAMKQMKAAIAPTVVQTDRQNKTVAIAPAMEKNRRCGVAPATLE